MDVSKFCTMSSLDAAVDLHFRKSMSDATYAVVLDAIGLQACVDLVGNCRYFTLISMTINVFDFPDGDGLQLPQIDLEPHDYFQPNRPSQPLIS